MDIPEVNCPDAYELYNGKRVGFLLDTKPRPTQKRGTFLVALNSKWIRVDADAGFSEGGVPKKRPFYIHQELIKYIHPAPQDVLEQTKGMVQFVISQVLPVPPLNNIF